MAEDLVADYLQRMKGSRQFKMIGVEPVWAPGTGDIDGFIHDEVVRQYHDPRIERDGGDRIRWMRSAWDFALRQSGQGGLPIGAELPEGISLEERLPDMDDILRLGATIEPHVNSTIGFRTMNVYIGSDMGAPPRLLSPLMTMLVTKVSQVAREQGNPGPSAKDYRNLWKNLRESIPPVDGSAHTIVLDRFAKLVDGITTTDDWYLAYEAIHPFSDGNGRSGKVLFNWLLGTLNDPVLVADHFKGGNP